MIRIPKGKSRKLSTQGSVEGGNKPFKDALYEWMEENPEGSWAVQLLFESNPDIKVSHQDLCEVIRDADGIFEDELVVMKNTDMDKEHKEQYSADKLWMILLKVLSLTFWKNMKEISWNKKWFMNRQ